MQKIRAGPSPAFLIAIVFLVAGALWCTGCSSDQAMRDKSLEFTNVNEETVEKDRRADLPADTITDNKAKFTEHRNVALGKVDEKASGEELKQQLIGIVDDQEAIWRACKRPDLPDGYVNITLDEFRSQRDLLRGK